MPLCFPLTRRGLFAHVGTCTTVAMWLWLWLLARDPPCLLRIAVVGLCLCLGFGCGLGCAASPSLSEAPQVETSTHPGMPGATPKPVRYVAPSLAKAQTYIDDHHPRMIDVRSNKKRPFPVGKTRMGRHCFMCCRRVDPFHEGLESWFTEFGAGVTLYVHSMWCGGGGRNERVALGL